MTERPDSRDPEQRDDHPNDTKPPRPAILAGHRQVGKRFIPPLAQLNLKPVSYTVTGIPELLWIALLQHQVGEREAADICARIAKAFVAPDQNPAWCACATVLGQLAEDSRTRLQEAIDHKRDAVAEALAPLARQYPNFPLSYLSSASNASEHRSNDLERLKLCVSSVYDKRSTPGMRMQATAIYMAFIGEQLVVSPDTSLANFPEIEKYPATEESRAIGVSVCATVNMLIGTAIANQDRLKWANYFWNRGLELEPIDSSLVLSMSEYGADDA